uniref:Odorant receptor 22 n=1 Tax=Cephus cinctus TaxID=211228 RepID=A0A1W6L1F2_CEPCN|nr:odorant receptor 22 [Cephus cinctus]
MDISGATKVLQWNNRLLRFLGLWPFDLNNVKFMFFFTYVTVQCFLQYAGLLEYISDLNYVVANLTETIIINMLIFKISIYRINTRQLRELIQNIEKDFSTELYNTADEMTIFLKYNSLSKTIVQCISIVCGATAVLFYIRNSSSAFLMPYHIRLFFNLTEARTYYIVYACEIFMIPLVTCGYAGPSCLLITLVLHICGQVSILTCQVENLIKNPETIHHQLKQIVLKHRRLINLCMNLNSTYATFLLQELIGITLLLCLGGYNIIATPILDETGHFLAFLLYTVTVIFQLLGFCYIGECLRNESKSLCDAFYN